MQEHDNCWKHPPRRPRSANNRNRQQCPRHELRIHQIIAQHSIPVLFTSAAPRETTATAVGVQTLVHRLRCVCFMSGGNSISDRSLSRHVLGESDAHGDSSSRLSSPCITWKARMKGVAYQTRINPPDHTSSKERSFTSRGDNVTLTILTRGASNVWVYSYWVQVNPSRVNRHVRTD